MIANEADGVQNMVWPDEILDQLRAAWDEVVLEEIADNPDAQALTEGNSIPRVGTSDEVAQAVDFLVQNDFVTGTTVDVDGGWILS